jgi:hypothetical protein
MRLLASGKASFAELKPLLIVTDSEKWHHATMAVCSVNNALTLEGSIQLTKLAEWFSDECKAGRA